ncbi:MAG: DUF4105 domain-containing protein [Bdellovibrionota bacterium]|nr:DUF4105 domain-containing protein [Bdellovibrionota bacterium]
MKFVSLLLCILFNSTLLGASPQVDRQWLNLYRYHLDGSDSLVTNDSFFFHPEGRHNPLLEMKEAIKVLNKESKARCKYPARTIYLQKKGHLKSFNDNCPDYNYFKRKLNLESIWIVFASYYVNNPSSAFGHTLFKIKGKNNNNDFLEWGVNFAAQPTTDNAFFYALLGLVGGFKGNFSLLPYFIKIAEYNDSETRDLWEYQLDFNDEEKELFQAHLWEMDKALFDYYYLSENCSYHLLYFLDTVRPSLNFIEKMPYFALPSETLLLVNQADNLVTEINQRPSQFKRVQKRYQNLSKSSKEGNPQNEQDKADLLDYKIDLMDLEKGSALRRKEEKVVKEKRSLQAKRASYYNYPTKPLSFSNEGGPHLIHPPRYFSFGYDHFSFEEKDFNAITFDYRFSFHEYDDPALGAPDWSQLMLGSFKLAYDTDRKNLQVRKFTLFKAEANTANIHETAALTWGASAGARDNIRTQAYDFGPYVRSLVGINWRSSKNLFRVVLPFEMDYSSPSVKHNRFKYSGDLLLEVMRNFSSHLRLRVGLGTTMDNYRHRKPKLLAHLKGQLNFTKTAGIRFKTQLIDEDLQAQTQILYSF